MVHPSEFFTLGLSSIICEQERSILEVMCVLSAFECHHCQEQIFTAPH
jgi:hypothetical protein